MEKLTDELIEKMLNHLVPDCKCLLCERYKDRIRTELDKGRRAISLLKELRSQISDYNGHGNPGCPDRASAVIALAHTDKFLKEYE